MPYFRDNDGALVIEPHGDIFFADATSVENGESFIEMIIASPGKTMAPGSLGTEYCGKSTGDIGTLVRIRLSPVVCAIMIERLAMLQTKLMGMPALYEVAPIAEEAITGPIENDLAPMAYVEEALPTV